MGSVFAINKNGSFHILYAFSGLDDGGDPNASLLLGSDGNLYGTTFLGGTNGAGVVFRISTSGALTSLYSFSGGNDGAEPLAGLVQGSDGSFYGTTSYGGEGAAWTVFRLSIAQTSPVFQVPAAINGALNLTWTTDAGGTYQLQYSSDLSSSNWINLGSAIVVSGTTLSAKDFVTNAPRKFYRVVVSR